MRFVLQVHSQLALSIAAAHGAADAGRHPAQLLIYGLALLPWPGCAVTAAFAASSVVHFAQDVGVRGSLLLHAAATVLACRDAERAVKLMLAHLVAVHIPRLAMVLADKGHLAALACMLYTVIIFSRWRVPRVERGEYCFGHKEQLLVVCHVIISIVFPW